MAPNPFGWLAILDAKLGVRSLQDLIGRTDLLEILPGTTAKQQNLDLEPLLFSKDVPADKPQFCESPRNPPFDKGLTAEKMVEMARAAIDGRTGGEFELSLTNCDRSIGARVSGEIAKVHGNQGMASAPITFRTLEGENRFEATLEAALIVRRELTLIPLALSLELLLFDTLLLISF